jgi:hypothetical protein
MDDQQQALAKARQFTETAFGVEVGKISVAFQEKLRQSRAVSAQMGTLRSGMTVAETARIEGEKITALLQARLDCRLEGFELHGVTLTDGMLGDLIKELTALRSTWITNSRNARVQDAILSSRLVSEGHYVQMVEQHVGLHANEIRTQVDRWRFMRKKDEGKPEPQSQVINFHGPVTGSIIQQGDHNTANLNYVADVQKVLDEMRETLNAVKLTDDAKRELRAEFETVETQTKSPRPKHAIIKQSLESAKHILEHAFGAALATYYPVLLEFLKHH